jgi:hypothetical protein
MKAVNVHHGMTAGVVIIIIISRAVVVVVQKILGVVQE